MSTHLFPTTQEEARTWRPHVVWCPLAMKVLVVAQTRVEGTWSAYCDAVPGVNHSQEYQEVLRHGDKLLEEHARMLFPQLDDIPYAN